MLCDAHCHFFSPAFFAGLAKQRGIGTVGVFSELGWDDPQTPAALADRWIRELDAHGVSRTALIASMPGDEASVGDAIARHPSRFVGYFMLDPAAPNAVDRTRRALTELGLRVVCLFPAMHGVALDDSRTRAVVEAAAAVPRSAVFVHCGALSIGVRKKLGLPSRFDLRLGDPLAVARLATDFPKLPFVIPHFGAGLFREALMAADACQNIHLDTSSSNGWIRYMPALTIATVFRTALSVCGPSRLIFGTDSSFFPRGWQKNLYDSQKSVIDTLDIAEGDVSLIFGGNFQRIFPQ